MRCRSSLFPVPPYRYFVPQEEAYKVREDVIRGELSERFRTDAHQAGVGLDMKSSGEGA